MILVPWNWDQPRSRRACGSSRCRNGGSQTRAHGGPAVSSHRGRFRDFRATLDQAAQTKTLSVGTALARIHELLDAAGVRMRLCGRQGHHCTELT